MISIRVGPDDLAALRFATDAVWETTASLITLMQPRQHVLHRRLRSLVPARPRFDLALLRELTTHSHWIPDTLGPQPSVQPADPPTQFFALTGTNPDTVAADLETLKTALPGGRAASMTPEQFLEGTATALTGCWKAVLEPLWDRIEAITQTDIAHHATALVHHGFSSAIAGIHPELAYSAGEITVAMSPRHTVDASGRGIWFVPSVFRWPWLTVGWVGPCPVISYSSRGAARLWEPTGQMNEVLPSLLGRTRAAIFVGLDVPRTTTSLARILGITPGTVSFHLGVLTASGLTVSRRAGRNVLYEQTVLGEQLVTGR